MYIIYRSMTFKIGVSIESRIYFQNTQSKPVIHYSFTKWELVTSSIAFVIEASTRITSWHYYTARHYHKDALPLRVQVTTFL